MIYDGRRGDTTLYNEYEVAMSKSNPDMFEMFCANVKKIEEYENALREIYLNLRRTANGSFPFYRHCVMARIEQAWPGVKEACGEQET